jgi:hypothetical protein
MAARTIYLFMRELGSAGVYKCQGMYLKKQMRPDWMHIKEKEPDLSSCCRGSFFKDWLSVFLARLSVFFLGWSVMNIAFSIFQAHSIGYVPEGTLFGWARPDALPQYPFFVCGFFVRHIRDFFSLGLLSLICSLFTSLASLALEFTKARLAVLLLCLSFFAFSYTFLGWLMD